jgi:hypothetical protein
MQRAGGREINIEFKRLSEVDKIDMINLANDPLVRRHMPLSSGTFDEADSGKSTGTGRGRSS